MTCMRDSQDIPVVQKALEKMRRLHHFWTALKEKYIGLFTKSTKVFLREYVQFAFSVKDIMIDIWKKVNFSASRYFAQSPNAYE